MDLLKAYKENPCEILSIPYWKNKLIKIPPNMKIVHGSCYSASYYADYFDEPYFRLYHPLDEICCIEVKDIRIITATTNDIPAMVNVINRSYTDLSVTNEQLVGYTKTEVYHPDLWIMAIDETNSDIAGCGIADFDGELREGIIEWVQVLPEYRGRRIGQLIVSELLQRLAAVADFATVSGKVNNHTAPERLYRKCGFVGDDVWHVLYLNI